MIPGEDYSPGDTMIILTGDGHLTETKNEVVVVVLVLVLCCFCFCARLHWVLCLLYTALV